LEDTTVYRLTLKGHVYAALMTCKIPNPMELSERLMDEGGLQRTHDRLSTAEDLIYRVAAAMRGYERQDAKDAMSLEEAIEDFIGEVGVKALNVQCPKVDPNP
jgi:hypothetical protein